MTDLRTRTLRILLAGALGLGLVGGAANAASALTPPAPQQQGPGAIANPTGPTDPTPPQGPGDLTNGEDEDDCHPLAFNCDITSNPGGGSDDDSDVDGDPEVDDSVVATPTFTG